MLKKTNSSAFKVGDRVVGVGIESGVDIGGLTGTIMDSTGRDVYCVEFDEPNIAQFHSCAGRTKRYHGLYCRPEVLSPYYEGEEWELDCDLIPVMM